MEMQKTYAPLKRITIGPIEGLVNVEEKQLFPAGKVTLFGMDKKRVQFKTEREDRVVHIKGIHSAKRADFFEFADAYLTENGVWIAEANFRPATWMGNNCLTGMLYMREGRITVLPQSQKEQPKQEPQYLQQ
ncbi:MAG: hypothetical protein QF486_00350 [Candidatus Woesearchaeota archaeon]|nr:hypothetical protein [Candidatus Woesearchaeota archaeon]MDP7198055.1 hypothetical protein [Candidatus Woesearchaeota archaeon]MDP7466889.1 hypothetical protein [Candidatus Woesearchaeota archaeon]MDP7647324.1 hypothetical protein [Candidatus Woesearchaeota archaeon]